MDREFCIAEVVLQDTTPLVVATGHLENLCRWEHMCSEERVDLANEAVISDCDWIDLYAVLCDFRLSGIEMVGLEAIPGLFYFKVKKLMLPVFPSDHFGLLLTICAK
ncbi:hypothetical protein LguiA_015142 [Lonicera macranthoides]